MPGRQWSDGLHQAVEAKEGVPSKKNRRLWQQSHCRTSLSCTTNSAA
jgi:preprotein translocase subunit SecA